MMRINNLITSVLIALCLLSLLGCTDDAEFPYNLLIGRWKVLTIRGELSDAYFAPIIESIREIDSARTRWHFIFEDDGTWSSVINFTGLKSNLNDYEETIKISGTYRVECYEKGETDNHIGNWILTLESTNLYSSFDLIKRLMSLFTFPVVSGLFPQGFQIALC